jgi:MFS transporter, FSR family, fosmidomycin resistance protein
MRDRAGALCQLISNFGHYYVHVAMLLYATVVLALEVEFGMSYGELLALSLLSFILFGAGALPAGWLGDRWSQFGMMLIYFFGTGLSTIAAGFANTPLQITVALAGIGLFGSIYHPVGIAWLVRSVENQGRALGYNGLSGALGVASASFVAGILTEYFSWRAAFILPGLICTAGGFVLWFCVRSGWLTSPTIDRKPHPSPTRGNIIRVAIVLTITMACSGFYFQVMSVAMPKVFVERASELTDGSLARAGSLASTVFLAAAAAQIVGGYLADRAPIKLIYVGAYAGVAALMGLAASATEVTLVGLCSLAMFLQTTAVPVENMLLTRYSPGRWRATLFGAKFVLALGVSAAAIPAVGMIRDQTGDFFWLFALLTGLTAIVVLAGMFLPGASLRQARKAITRPVPGPAE